MKKIKENNEKTFCSIYLAIVLVTTIAGSVQGSYYWVGNSRYNAYGVKANIQCPNFAPYIPGGAIYGWVSTENFNKNWVQTGWLIYMTQPPKSYREYHMNGGQDQDLSYISTLSYGDVSEYKVYYYGGGWYAYINGGFVGSFWGGGLPTPPWTMVAFAEVWPNSTNQLYSYFNDVSWRNSYGNWNAFDQANFREDSPYAITVNSNDEYSGSGPW